MKKKCRKKVINVKSNSIEKEMKRYKENGVKLIWIGKENVYFVRVLDIVGEKRVQKLIKYTWMCYIGYLKSYIICGNKEKSFGWAFVQSVFVTNRISKFIIFHHLIGPTTIDK